MQQSIDSPSAGRALVSLEPAAAPEASCHRPVQRMSTFVAQLIATARQMPQTRERRRADPEDVIAAYRATIERIQELNEQSH